MPRYQSPPTATLAAATPTPTPPAVATTTRPIPPESSESGAALVGIKQRFMAYMYRMAVAGGPYAVYVAPYGKATC